MKSQFDTSKRGAEAAGVHLADDVADWSCGVTKHRNVKRTDKICPRCRSKNVSRDYRKCLDCHGRLLWSGDDIQPFLDRYEHFFMWYKSVFGLEGWFDADYFKGDWEKLKL